MLKAGARVGCGVAAAAVVGIHGKTVEPGASHSLMQGASMSSIAVGSTSKYHEQSARLFDELEKLAAQGKELPASIKAFIEGIKTAAEDITKKLADEHKLQKADLDDKFGAFATCDTALNTKVASIDGDGPESAKKLAASAKVALCTCRKAEVVAKFDCEGCDDELDCRKKDVAAKSAAESAFVRVDGDTVVNQFVGDSGAAICEDALSISSSSGVSEDAQALAWFDNQDVMSKTHWVEKETKLQALVDAHKAARETRDALENGTGKYEDKGCESLCKVKNAKNIECTAAQGRATLSQCGYYTNKKAACDDYLQCHSDAKKAWDEAKARETKDSQDRKDGWATAKKIGCLADSFVSNDAGNVEIDRVASGKCSSITCDDDCILALDLSVSLARPTPAAASCSLPSMPCSKGGWQPSCNGDETGSWGDHTPLYFVGARTGSQCTVAAVPMGLANGQVTESCQQCDR